MVVEYNGKRFKARKVELQVKLDGKFYTLDEIREKIKIYDKDGKEIRDYTDVELLTYLHQINLIKL